MQVMFLQFFASLALFLPYVIGFSTIADEDRLKHDLSKFLSISRHDKHEKLNARESIKKALQAVGLNSMTHTFIHEETDEIGANVLAVQKSKYFGTSRDRLIVLSANYDTLANNPGVDDNGSGVAAIIETARIMTTLDSLYSREYTIVYAFFDMKQKSLAGSHAFVEDILLPVMERTGASVEASIVVDGVLHFDPFPASQAMPKDFEINFPEAAQRLHEHSHMGDFIQITARRQIDENVRQMFHQAFTHSCEILSKDWQFNPWLLDVLIDISNITSIDRLYKLHPYIYSDHSSFFFHSLHDRFEIPTIYLTDTLNHRGVRQYCKDCDGLYMMTEQNIKFLALVTDALIRFTIVASQSNAVQVIDDLYSFAFNIDVE